MKTKKESWENRFDKKFIQFENGVPVGGFERPPYERIKQFIKEQIEKAKEDSRRQGAVETVEYMISTCEEQGRSGVPLYFLKDVIEGLEEKQ